MNELKNNIKEFITGGNSTFTILNEATGVRYTFRVVKAEDSDMFFVSHLNGSDNESNYSYMGIITNTKKYTLTKKSRVTPDSTVNKAFRWLWNCITNNKDFPESFHFYHEGKCARCGRKLTTPESIERGFGPVCWGA